MQQATESLAFGQTTRQASADFLLNLYLRGPLLISEVEAKKIHHLRLDPQLDEHEQDEQV